MIGIFNANFWHLLIKHSSTVEAYYGQFYNKLNSLINTNFRSIKTALDFGTKLLLKCNCHFFSGDIFQHGLKN